MAYNKIFLFLRTGVHFFRHNTFSFDVMLYD
jgi:hypothetical protein